MFGINVNRMSTSAKLSVDSITRLSSRNRRIMASANPSIQSFGVVSSRRRP